jgi:membrane-bound lytic murein transglycosylase B
MPNRTALLLAACFLLHACTAERPAAPPLPTAQRPAPKPARSVPAQSEPEGPISSTGPGIADRADVRAFIGEMSRKHGFSTAELSQAFDRTHIQPAILEAMAKPYEAKPWYAYRKLFLTEKRITGGRDFMAVNAAALKAAEARYGVSRYIITAIIGIESAYGNKPGKYRVIESLSTLSFEYPRRAPFFRSELEQFLLLSREEGMDYLAPLGSYAGAMGMPQFMPSSYRKLAADGDGDGRRDIWNNPADAIASVARYFNKNGWHTGEPIATPATVGGAAAGLAGKKPKLSQSLSQLMAAGVHIEDPISGDPKAGLVALEGETGPDYWVAFHNFNVIMRYNNSPLYAMAAYEISRELAGSR